MSDNDITTKLYFGPWYRRSPFFEATRRAGCAAYDIYNKMYLPAEYDDPNVEYQALNDGVTLWDVGVERTVQIRHCFENFVALHKPLPCYTNSFSCSRNVSYARNSNDFVADSLNFNTSAICR